MTHHTMSSGNLESAGSVRPSTEADSSDPPKAPDGGWGWVCVLACTSMHIVTGGASRASGILFLKLQEEFDRPATQIAWIIAISDMLRLLLSPVVSSLSNRYSCRSVAFTGGLLCSLGFILSALIPKYEFMFFSYGILFGIGRSLVYTPYMVILGFYFDKRRSMATGLGTAGTSIGTLFIPPLVEWLFQYFTFSGAMLLMAGSMLHLCISSSLLRPIELQYRLMAFSSRQKQRRYMENDVFNDSNMVHHSEKKRLNKETPLYTQTEDKNGYAPKDSNSDSNKNAKSASYSLSEESQKATNYSKDLNVCKMLRSLFFFSLLKDVRFVCYCFCILLYNASIKNVLTFLPAMAKDDGVGDFEAAYLLSIFGATDFVGRISSSVLDAKALKPYRRYIYIVIPGLLGVITFLFTIVETMTGYGILVSFAGLFVGLFVSQKSVVIVDLLDPGKLMDAFGLVCMFQGLGALAGPPIAGFLRDHFLSFTESFYFGCSTFLASAAIMLLGYVIALCQQKKSNRT